MKPCRRIGPLLGLAVAVTLMAAAGCDFYREEIADKIFGIDDEDRPKSVPRSPGRGFDVNGDGVPDLLVGAPDAGGGPGRLYIFFGGSGLSSAGAGTADVILTGTTNNDDFGIAVTAADLNADGVDDLIVGAQRAGGPGSVFIFFGGSQLTSKGAAAADIRLTGEASGDLFGQAVAAGDLNADGRPDVVVGAFDNDAGGVSAGRAYVFFGGAGLTTKGAGAADATFTGEAASDFLGDSVGVADVNADGIADLIVGADGNDGAGASSGRVYVFFGSAAFATKAVTLADAILSGTAGQSLGYPLTTGDVNNDGFPDLIACGVGGAGSVFVFFGGPGFGGSKSTTAANRTFTGEAANDQFGYSLGTGDVDGDGAIDIIVAAEQNDAGGSNAGRCYVFLGGKGIASKGAAAADFIITGEAAEDRFGGSSNFFGVAVGSADVNGDGIDDLLVGALNNDAGGADSGRIYVFFGGTLRTTSAVNASLAIHGEAAGDNLFAVPAGN